MNSLVRKLAITGGVAAVLLAAGGTTAATTAHAAGSTALSCVVTGQATGLSLGLPPGGQQNFNYSGSATCAGVLAGHAEAAAHGSIQGSGSCPSGSLATCLAVPPFATISCNINLPDGTSLTDTGGGKLLQVGPLVVVACNDVDSAGTPVHVAATVVFTPATVGTPPVTAVNFDGTATAAG